MGGDPGAMVVPFGIILSAVVVAIFLVTGWLGGELVFRHRIGMIDDESEPLRSAAGAPSAGINLSHAGRRRAGGHRVLGRPILLFGCTFSFFLHLCGGIRHLVWDAGYGFELGAIYGSGWTVVGVSTALTVITWITSSVLAG